MALPERPKNTASTWEKLAKLDTRARTERRFSTELAGKEKPAGLEMSRWRTGVVTRKKSWHHY